jgi:hypothetical protein
MSTSCESAFVDLFYALSEQRAVDVARAMQDADDLNAFGSNPVQDQVWEFDQGAGLGRYIRPARA